MERGKVLLYHLISVFLVYINIIISFSLVYLYLDFTNLGPIVDHYSTQIHQSSWFDRMTRSFYFSSITLMSVGYGDITPFGWSKAVAVLEALIGYILPPTLIVKYVLFPSESFQKVMATPYVSKKDES